VLALFCAAWLQAAIVPCVMAHGETAPPPDEALVHAGHAGHAGHAAHGGHDHAALSDGPVDDGASHPCLYCPPGESGGDSCDGHGGCAYPHDPTVDARGAGAIFAAVPVSFFAPVYGAAQVLRVAEPSVAAIVPRVPLSVSYCRFIE
jgi:hypothetical protein